MLCRNFQEEKMIRNRDRKTNLGLKPAEEMKKALDNVTLGGMKVLAAAKQFSIPR